MVHIRKAEHPMTHVATPAILGTRTITIVLFAIVILMARSSVTNAQWTTNGNDVYKTNTSGNVGIGTTSPTSSLEIQGADGPLTLSQAGVTGKVTIQAAIGTDLHLSANAKYSSSNWNRFDISLPSWNFMASPSSDFAGIRRASAASGVITWVDFLRVTSSGNVGIGTTSPQNALDVNGSLLLRGNTAMSNPSSVGPVAAAGYYASGGYAFFQGYNYTTNQHTQLDIDGSKTVINANSGGNVGIGTASPAARLQVSGGSAFITGDSGGLVSSAGPGLALKYTSGTAQIFGYDYANTAPKNLILQYPGGNVGIGTANPNYRLDVNGTAHVTGDMTVDGNLSAKYQDVAEWVESSQALTAGTVVVLDQTKSNQVIASSQAYDTRVAGVISLQPGITLGEKSESKVLVATTGRVRIRVDASRGAINIGDLLVTSNVQGTAMKSQPIDVGGIQIHRPGTLIGKALEPLASGTGEILTLLSLQ